MDELTEEEVKKIKLKYPKGTKIKLIHMNDYIHPVLDGTMGIVDHVDDVGTIHMNWETGSSLGLIVGEDEFEVITNDDYEKKDEELEESELCI